MNTRIIYLLNQFLASQLWPLFWKPISMWDFFFIYSTKKREINLFLLFDQYYVIDDFRLRLPDIEINIEGDAIVDETFTCQLSFQNPLPKPLTRGKFTVEGPDYSNRVVANLHR